MFKKTHKIWFDGNVPKSGKTVELQDGYSLKFIYYSYDNLDTCLTIPVVEITLFYEGEKVKSNHNNNYPENDIEYEDIEKTLARETAYELIDEWNNENNNYTY